MEPQLYPLTYSPGTHTGHDVEDNSQQSNLQTHAHLENSH